MSTPIKYLLGVLPSVHDVHTDYGLITPRCLDLGGGNGHLRGVTRERGYFYTNVDIRPGADVIADVHALPFKDKVFHLIISKDSLEHFYAPKRALAEAARVLMDWHWLIIIVPWMHPFHRNDYYRFSPLSLRNMLRDISLRIKTIDSPTWIFTILAVMAVRLCNSMHLPFLGGPLRKLGYLLDDLFAPHLSAFAASYRVVARKQKCSSRDVIN